MYTCICVYIISTHIYVQVYVYIHTHIYQSGALRRSSPIGHCGLTHTSLGSSLWTWPYTHVKMSESQCIPYHNVTEFQYILHHWPIPLHDNDPHKPRCGRHCAMCPYMHLRMSEFQYILHHDIDLLRYTICTHTHLVGGGGRYWTMRPIFVKKN